MDRRVAAWYRVGNWSRNLIQRDIIDAEPPHELLDGCDMLLMGLWREKCLEEPLAIVDLADVVEFCQISDALPHDWDFAGSVMNFLDSDWLRRPSVDNASIILYGDELPFIVEHAPIFLDEAIDLVSNRCREMGQVQLLTELCAME